MLRHSVFSVKVEGKKMFAELDVQLSQCRACVEVTVKSSLGFQSTTSECVTGVVFGGRSVLDCSGIPKIIGFILQHLKASHFSVWACELC